MQLKSIEELNTLFKPIFLFNNSYPEGLISRKDLSMLSISLEAEADLIIEIYDERWFFKYV